MSFSPPNYTLSVVSYNPLAGKSSLCERLIDSNLDNYKTFLLTNNHANSSWFYWGSIKHRRLDEKREGIFHLIEHSSIHIDEKEFIDNYIKRLSLLTFRIEEKNLPKDKLHVDAFLCIYDLSFKKSLSDFLILLHGLLKTRRPLIIVTTKNDLIDNQISRAEIFEQSIHHSFSTIPILHTSAHEHVNIQSVLELALYACDETTKKHFYKKYHPPNYLDAYKNEQSLKHVIQTEYRALLNRHVPDYRIVSWEKFYDRWQHHTSVQTFIDMFGKQQAKCLFDEHIEELKRISREKLIDERLIPIIEYLIPDHKSKLSRNWDYVRLQMQKHPRYSSTVIPASIWSDSEHNNSTNLLLIPDDLLDTPEARIRFDFYYQTRQAEQIRRTNCRAFFELLNRFSQVGLIQYGDTFDKDCVYFLGRESYESLNGHDRLRVFSLHQSYLYRLICLKFVELLFESFEIFLNTFEKMHLATKLTDIRSEKFTSEMIDDIFERDILEQIKHDQRYQSLNTRDTDRHRLIMCHCHFLYNSIYYPSMNITQLIKQHRQSFKNRKISSNQSLSNQLNIDENFCPYTRKTNLEHEKKNFEIICPMEINCADMRIVQEIFSRLKVKNKNKNVFILGNDEQVNLCLKRFLNDLSDLEIQFFTIKTWKNQPIDGCICLSENVQQLISQKKIHLNIDLIPMIHLDGNPILDIPIDQLRSSIENLFSNENIYSKKPSKIIPLKILICFMCGVGGDEEKNDVELFFSQLSSRFSLTITNQSTFLINIFLNRTNRKIELIPVSFHSLFAVKLTDFNGFILVYDRERQAAENTMMYLKKHISTTFENENIEQIVVKHPPMYLLACVKDPALSNIRRISNQLQKEEQIIQCHCGTIRNFLEFHFVAFLNQCWIEKFGPTTEHLHEQNKELLVNVTSYFDHNRAIHLSAADLMTSSLDRSYQLNLASKSTEHSPKHHSLSTPTNQDTIFSYRSYPYLSNSTNGTELTIVPTTPIDPSIPNLLLVSSSSICSNSILDSQQKYFQKSTSMRFAKLIEHPTDKNTYQSSLNNGDIISRRKISESEDMKFRLYKHRTAPQVKVPLATPEIIELSEILTQPFSIQEYYESSPKIKNSTDEQTTNIEPSKATQVTDSSVDSSNDERVQNSTPLQRKPSDRKTKRARAKQNDVTGSTSSNEVLKKRSDEDDKRMQKKKRRPSVKKRKKSIYDQGQTDSGIDSRMDSSKLNNTPEPSTSVVISNEDDSSVGDGIRDSKHASAEELEERPTANWIRRQLQYFAQVRREKTELRTRSSALTTITSVSSPPLFKATLTSTSPAPLSSLENSHHQVPIRLNLSRCVLSNELGIPMFVVQCIRFIEEHGLTIEGLYRISGHKNQVEFVINKLLENPNLDLNILQVPASAVATAFKDMMRKLDEPILSLEQFDDCQSMTIEQLREENFSPLQEALLRTNDLKYRTNKFIFKHLHFVSQHTALTHMDSSNLAVLWWPNLFQPQFHDLRTAEQICQKAKPLIQTIIDNYPIIFNVEQIKEKN